MIQDFDILGSEGLFLFCTLLKVLKQDISSFFCLALTIIIWRVITKEFLSLAALSGAQTFRVHKLSKVDMIGKHKDFMLKVF